MTDRRDVSHDAGTEDSGTALDAATEAVQRLGREPHRTPDEVGTPTGGAKDRLDRGWQRAGALMASVVKSAVVAGAVHGVIPQSIATKIVSSKPLKGA